MKSKNLSLKVRKEKQTMKKIISLCTLLFCLFIVNNTYAFIVDGFCELQAVSNYSNIKVLFNASSPSAHTDSTFTNSDGSFSIDISEGIYSVYYSKSGWYPYNLPEDIGVFADTTLELVTLVVCPVEVEGSQNGVWTTDNPIWVNNDIYIENGNSLIIEPGVIIQFKDNYSFIIYGTLLAVGTVTDSILFSSLGSRKDEQNPGDWELIKFEGTSSSSSIIAFTKIEYAKTGIRCDEGASPTIRNNHIYYNGCGNSYHGGIVCYNSSSPQISENKICNNNRNGIYCINSSPLIKNNIIYNNGDEELYHGGIYCTTNSEPIICNNKIFNNIRDGISCVTSSPTIENNLIYNNEIHGIYCESYSPLVTNNTISSNEIGIDFSPADSVSIINNIIYDNDTGIKASDNKTILEYNLFWQNTTNCDNFIPPYFGIIVTTNANGDSSDTYYNLFFDPLFLDPDSLDFHLNINSTAIDAGNPDPMYNDPENPINPGYAIQPALGTIVNDMGAYGGQSAAGWPTVYPVIYPGDTNNNGIVDTLDILPIGQYFRETGPIRENASLEWEPQFLLLDWTNNDCAYADCNGKGEVNIADVLAICINWGKTHNKVGLEITFSDEELINNKEKFLQLYNGLGNSSVETSIRKFLANKFNFHHIADQTSILYTNTPNPFNIKTKIEYNIAKKGNIVLSIYNIKGQLVKILVNAPKSIGKHSIIWDGKDNNNSVISNGIYFCKLENNGKLINIRRMALIK